MPSPTSWEFYKEVETKILWVNICTQDFEGVAISINKWVRKDIQNTKSEWFLKKNLK